MIPALAQALPSASPSSSHKPQPARGGAALGNSTFANYYFLEHGVGTRLLCSVPHSSFQMPERENAGGSEETLQLPLLTLGISTT